MNLVAEEKQSVLSVLIRKLAYLFTELILFFSIRNPPSEEKHLSKWKTKGFEETKEKPIFESKATILKITTHKDGDGILKPEPDPSKRDNSKLIEMVRMSSEASPLHVQAEGSRFSSSRVAILDPDDSIPDSGTPVKKVKTVKFDFTQ